IAQAGRRKISVHGLPSRTQMEGTLELLAVFDLVWKSGGALGSRMCLVHVAVFRTQQGDGVCRAAHAINRSVLGIARSERIVRIALHEPVNRLGKCDSPVPSQVSAHLFAWYQQEVRVRLRAACME